MDAELPDFYSFEDALWRLDADFSAAEVQGIYSAVLSINVSYPARQLHRQVVPEDAGEIHDQEMHNQLQQLYAATRTLLNTDSLQFVLLLPDDNAALSERLLALQKWCQGYAYGLALSGLPSLEKLPQASREWVEDVIKIGSSGEFDLEDEEASEQALLDLVEFVRVGVLMVNEEMQPVQGMPQTTLH